MSTNVVLTRDQQMAANTFWATHHTLLVVAAAGTGKSTATAHIRNSVATGGPCAVNSNARLEAAIFVAPTGIAARQLPPFFIPEGKSVIPAMTIARLLKQKFLETLQWKICKKTILFVHIFIDEFPMVDAEQFDALMGQVAALNVRSRVVLLGDPHQLPAVGISIFNSLVFRRLMNGTHSIVKLTTQVRHMHCPTHDMLPFCNAVRARNATRTCLFIQERTVQSRPPPAGGHRVVYLTALNEKRLMYIDKALAYSHNVNGSTLYTLVSDSGLLRFTCGPVMILKNNKDDRSLVNGLVIQLEAITGTPCLYVDPLYPFARVLKCDAKLCLHLIDDDGTERTLRSSKVQHTKDKYEITAASGAALTIHKTQGLTIPMPFVVVVDLNNFTSFAMLYVAITRVRQFRQLYFLPCDLDNIARLINEPLGLVAAAFDKHVEHNARTAIL